VKQNKTSQLLLALLVLGGTFLISEKVQASTEIYIPLSSTGLLTETLGTSAEEDEGTNITSLVWYVSTYPSTVTTYCSSGNLPFSSWGIGFDVDKMFKSGCNATADDGNYWVRLQGSGFDYYAIFIKSGGTWQSGFNPTTRIDTVSPPNASTTGYTTYLNATGYINENDYEEGIILRIRLANNTLQNGIGGSVLDAWNGAFGGFSIPITSAGSFDLGTTTTFDIDGQINIEWSLQVPNTTWLIGSFLSPQILVSSTTMFVVNQMTGLDIAMASTTDILVSALVTGTTTQSVIRCNPANFDITVCLISLIVPPRSVLEQDLTNFKNDVLNRFPIGYITRFLTILGSTATSSLPVFSATIPNALPFGQGQTIELDLNHSLDWILYATTSAYITAEASSTETLYDITSYYWNIMVYMALGFYIIRRIIGSHIIPKIKNK